MKTTADPRSSCIPQNSLGEPTSRQTILWLASLVLFLFSPVLRADLSYQDYYLSTAKLGPGYIEQFLRLTQKFGQSPRTANANLCAFSWGWYYGYISGAYGPYNYSTGNQAAQKDLEQKNLQAAQAAVAAWGNFQGNAQRGLQDVCWKAFQSAHRRGWTDASNNRAGGAVPAPTDYDFRLYWSPAGLIDPGTPGEDAWGDLRNTPR